jgi:hypothetical protein
MTSHRGPGSRSGMFEPHLRNFFIRSSDPAHVKILKLEVLTNLATAGNIGYVDIGFCQVQHLANLIMQST